VSTLHPALSAFAHRDFRWLWTGTFFSTAAQWIQQATLGWVVYDLTRSAALLGAVLGVRAIPMLLLAPVSGLVADRFERRKALVFSQAAPASMSFALALLLAFDAVEVWHFFAFALIGSAGTVFERTLRNTLVFDIVPRAEAANAIALNTIAFSITRTLGPACAGVLIASIGPAWNFAIQGTMYLGVTASVLMIRARPQPAGTLRPAAWRAIYAGFRFAATHPVARVMVVLGITSPLLLIPSISALMPVFAADVFAVGPEGLGLLLSAVGAGGIIGGIVAAAASRYDRIARLQSASLLAFALSVIVFALSPSLNLALCALTLAGAVEMTLGSSVHTALTLTAPEAMRGQVTSLLPMFPGFISLGSLGAGLGVALIGPQAFVITAATVALAVLALTWTQSQAFRTLRMSALVSRG
jgi:MFS family permease